MATRCGSHKETGMVKMVKKLCGHHKEYEGLDGGDMAPIAKRRRKGEQLLAPGQHQRISDPPAFDLSVASGGN